MAKLAETNIRLQIDIGFGDAVFPVPKEIIYPTLLEFPSPRVLSYSMYTVVAEKFQALVALGMLNSRMKDFFDIGVLAGEFEFSGEVLCSAIKKTFKRRNTELPIETPIALTKEFSVDKYKITQWNAFIRKNRLYLMNKNLAEIIDFLHLFLMPPLYALSEKKDFNKVWLPGGPWK